MLVLDRISKRYVKDGRRVQALDDVTLRLDEGAFAAVRGPSGSGKSTLLLAAGGLLAPDAGKVTVAGRDVYALSSEARAQFRSHAIGFVFQQFHLIAYLSVRENILTPAMASHVADAGRRADELIEQFGLASRASHVPGELSTGERQRTALARALMHRPKLLLADEPTGNLDPENAEAVLRALESFAHDGGVVLLVTHDTQAASRASRCLSITAGRLTDASQPPTSATTPEQQFDS